jgi:hypothetical protein
MWEIVFDAKAKSDPVSKRINPSALRFATVVLRPPAQEVISWGVAVSYFFALPSQERRGTCVSGAVWAASQRET